MSHHVVTYFEDDDVHTGDVFAYAACGDCDISETRSPNFQGTLLDRLDELDGWMREHTKTAFNAQLTEGDPA